ncbi:hypothetical protein E2C01_015467 [Portunus trituberculatus]|uniref:Uncharacterized protein n=1 Tax=Portunus trituberculatus TaxID=210409 RepID=A0A5B7DN30_PORTR|nr:hypothetical protein [Portunus trituberculatus]
MLQKCSAIIVITIIIIIIIIIILWYGSTLIYKTVIRGSLTATPSTRNVLHTCPLPAPPPHSPWCCRTRHTTTTRSTATTLLLR